MNTKWFLGAALAALLSQTSAQTYTNPVALPVAADLKPVAGIELGYAEAGIKKIGFVTEPPPRGG